MNPYVKSVRAKDDHCLLLTFENGEKRVFDLKPYLNKPVFTRLKNIALFKTVRVVSGSVEWQGEIDLSHDTLYLESNAVKTVKAVKANPLQRQPKKTRSLPGPAAVRGKKLPKVRIAAK